MEILIFVEGTILTHPAPDKVEEFGDYIPIKEAVAKINAWVEVGAEVSYLTSRTKFAEIKQIKDKLKEYNFPEGIVHARKENESYRQVVEALKPDVLIEYDCKSIGEHETISPKLNQDLNIHAIVVAEFGGIDHLPSNLEELVEYGKKEEKTETDEQ